MTSVEHVLTLQPRSVAAHLLKADLLRQSGQPQAAEEILRASLELDAEQPSAWYLLGLVLSETASSPIPENATQPSKGGASQGRLFCLERALSAIECFDEAIVRRPNEYASRLAKGMILARAARATDAEAKIRTHVAEQEMGDELGRQWAGPYLRRFECLLIRTCESLDEATRLRPDDCTPLLAKGDFLSEYFGLSQDLDAAAISAYEQVVALDRSNSVAHTALAELRSRIGKDKQSPHGLQK